MADLFETVTLVPLSPVTTTIAIEPVLKSLESDQQIQVAAVTNLTQLQQLSQDLDALKQNADQFFLVLMGAIIIFMQAGFAFLEAGSVRSKNVTNIIIKNYADLCFGALSYWLVGYSFAFGSGNPFIGLSGWVLLDVSKTDYAFFFFQSTFAATCATIVSGAIAERCNFNGYIFFSILLTGVVYPIQVHWAWSGEGWLSASGNFHDFAGSGVVHLAGGMASLVGAYMLGPRIGRFKHGTKGQDSIPISGHSVPFISLGAFILILTFMAFNGGSQAAISSEGDGAVVGRAMLNTLVGCCCSGLVVLVSTKIMPGGNWSLIKLINGCLAGMVSMCAGCDGYYPWAAALVACVAGVIYMTVSKLMLKVKIDDPLDAVAVHGGAGLWGILAAPIFMDSGILYKGTPESLLMLVWNAAGAGAFIVWNIGWGFIIFGLLKVIGLLRVNESNELQGLDELKHGEAAYPKDAYIEEQYSMSTDLYTESRLKDYMMTNGVEQWAKRTVINSFPSQTLSSSQTNGTPNIIQGNIMSPHFYQKAAPAQPASTLPLAYPNPLLSQPPNTIPSDQHLPMPPMPPAPPQPPQPPLPPLLPQ